jgi:hypothetical protein
MQWDVDHCPVSVQLDEPAAVDGPQEAGAAGIVEGPFGRTTEQSHRVPAQSGGTLGPVFGGAQEVFAVGYELLPTVPRDVIGRTFRVEPGNPLAPIDWNCDAVFPRGS